MFFALKVSLLPFCQPMSFITSAFLMPKPHLIGWVIIGCNKKPRKTKRNTIFLVMKMHRKVSSAKWRPFCPRVFYLQSTKFSSPPKGACHLTFIHVATIVMLCRHDDVIKWKHFPRYRPFVRGIHLSLVNSPHKGQWRGVLVFSLICVWTNGWVNNRDADDLRRHRIHYDVIILVLIKRLQLICRSRVSGMSLSDSTSILGSLLLTWFNFNPSMDK